MSDVVLVPQQASLVSSVTDGGDFFTSLRVESQKEKLAMLKAIANSQPLVDNVGAKIAIVDVIIQQAEFVDDESGEVTTGLRTTLIDADGNAFHAASKGIALAMKTVFNVLGHPNEWEAPYEVVVREGRKGKFRFLTLDPA